MRRQRALPNARARDARLGHERLEDARPWRPRPNRAAVAVVPARAAAQQVLVEVARRGGVAHAAAAPGYLYFAVSSRSRRERRELGAAGA